jgi:hypothetical protein
LVEAYCRNEILAEAVLPVPGGLMILEKE